MFWKILYVICRQSALFSLPILRNFRDFVYASHFNTSDIHVDDFVRIGPAHRTDSMSLIIAPGLRIGRNAEIDSSGGVVIKTRVSISEGAKIYTHNHNIDGENIDWRKNGIVTSELVIEADAWIGADAIILPNVTRIGRGAIIGAGSIVHKNVEDFSVIVGNPAKFLRFRKVDEISNSDNNKINI